MQTYHNTSGHSGIAAYEYDDDSITVRFKRPGDSGATTYVYTSESAGAREVAQMKKMANAGVGLNTFINQHVRGQYASKY